MNVLADTHAILWWLAEDKRLSKAASRILENPANRRFVSVASLWEIAIKIGTDKLRVRDVTLRDLVDQLIDQEFAILPIRLEDVLHLNRLPPIHRDPFDRILIAQALQVRSPMLTADSIISQYPIEIIW